MPSDELPQIGAPATRALAILEAALSERGLALLAEDGGGRRS